MRSQIIWAAFACLCLLSLRPSAVRAQSPIRAVIVQVWDDQVEINRGSKHGVREGMVFVVERVGQQIGRLRVTQVQETKARAAVLDDQGIELGGEAVSVEEPLPNPAGPSTPAQAGEQAVPDQQAGSASPPSASGAIQGVVTQIVDQEILFDRGADHGVQVGMVFIVQEQSQRRGRVQVVEVEAKRARAVMLENDGIGVGAEVIATDEVLPLPNVPGEPLPNPQASPRAEPAATAQPQPVRALVVEIEQGQARINCGSNHGVKTGMRFVVERQGQRQGRLRVSRVGATSSWASILEDEGMIVGDEATSEESVVPPVQQKPLFPTLPTLPERKHKRLVEQGTLRPRPARGYAMLDILSAEDLAYDWLRMLASRGRIPGYSVRHFVGEQQRLWTPKEIGQLLARSVGAYAQQPRDWDQSSRYALGRLLLRFGNEAALAGVSVERMYHELIGSQLGNRRLGNLLLWTGAAEAGGGAASSQASQGDAWARGTLIAGIGPRVDAFTTAQRSRTDPLLLRHDRRPIEQGGGLLQLSPDRRITLGRSFVRWGPGYYGALLLSDNAPAVDLLRLQSHIRLFNIPFELDQFHATFRDDGERRYLTGRRYSFLLGNRLEAALAETALIQDTVHLWPSVAVSPLFVLQLFKEPTLTSNFLGSADLAYHITDSSYAYLQWMVDDMTTKQPRVPRKMGFLVGGQWKDKPTEERWDLRVEYADIDPKVYGHRQTLAAWEVQDRVLGHRIGADAESVFLKLRYTPSPGHDVGLTLSRLRTGVHQSRPMHDHFWSLSYHHDVSTRAFVGVRWMNRNVRHLGWVAGMNRDERRLWLEAGYGF